MVDEAEAGADRGFRKDSNYQVLMDSVVFRRTLEVRMYIVDADLLPPWLDVLKVGVE